MRTRLSISWLDGEWSIFIDCTPPPFPQALPGPFVGEIMNDPDHGE